MAATTDSTDYEHFISDPVALDLAGGALVFLARDHGRKSLPGLIRLILRIRLAEGGGFSETNWAHL